MPEFFFHQDLAPVSGLNIFCKIDIPGKNIGELPGQGRTIPRFLQRRSDIGFDFQPDDLFFDLVLDGCFQNIELIPDFSYHQPGLIVYLIFKI